MSNSKTTTVRFSKFLKAIKNTPEPIDPDNISININTENKAELKPNFMALCILWAHYEACKQGLLTEDHSPPWEQFREDTTTNPVEPVIQQDWKDFLKNIVDDKWTAWIKKPDEVRKRTINAYEKKQAQS